MFKKHKNEIPARRRVSQGVQAPVFSYHASRLNQESPTGRHEQPSLVSQRRGPRMPWQSLPMWVSVFVCLMAALYLTTIDTNPRVALIGDGSALRHDAATYQSYAHNQLNAQLWSRSKLTVNTEAVASDIENHFPEVSDATVTIPLVARRPVIEIATVRPAFIVTSTTGGSYYVRPDGIASVKLGTIDNAPEGLIEVIDQSGLPLAAGQQILPATTVTFISEVFHQLKAKDVRVLQAVLPAQPNEVRIKPTGVSYYVRFNTEGDARLQSGVYLAVRDQLQREGKKIQEYVDVRVGERAYYK